MKTSDATKFKQALTDANFSFVFSAIIFNDKRKKFRRLKLWNGAQVANAPLKQRLKLVSNLQDQFGDRLLAVYPIKNLRTYIASSICVELTS